MSLQGMRFGPNGFAFISGAAALILGCGSTSSTLVEAGSSSGDSAGSTSGSSSGSEASSGSSSEPGSSSGSPDSGSPSPVQSGSSSGSSGPVSGSSGGPLDASSIGEGGGSCAPGGSGPSFADTPTQKATTFSNGIISPYTICTTQSPDFGRIANLNGDSSIEFFWTQVGYNGTRDRRGAEACSSLAFYKEGWYGFQFYLPSPGFPTDKTEGIGQIFALGGCSSWAAMLHVRNNALSIVHRGNCSATGADEVQLAADIPRNSWNPILIHFVVSNQKAGSIEIWYGDAVCQGGPPTYRKTGIDLGFGAWSGDTLVNVPGNNIGLKFGMYNFDDANYTAGETRTIYYDNVSQLVGNPPNAWAVVNPTQ
ncbi:MAG: polysaccharide lyase [Myxococcota bacterium]|nr:polysaccharide lyase [Myxococcota bacterium]